MSYLVWQDRRILLGAAVVSWLALLSLALIAPYFWPGEPLFSLLKGLALNTYLLSLHEYYRLFIKRRFSMQFYEMLKWTMRRSWVSVAISVGLLFSGKYLSSVELAQSDRATAGALLFYLQVAIGLNLALSVYVTWKTLLHYEAYEWVKTGFRFFQLALGISLFVHFFDYSQAGTFFYVLQALFWVMVLVFCLTMRWIADFTLSQKRMSLLWIGIVLAAMGYFYVLFEFILDKNNTLYSDLVGSLSLRALFGFIIMYGAAALLMTIFNIPTTSILDRKIQELQLFSEIGDSLYNVSSEQQIFDYYLQKVALMTKAEAGWVEDLKGSLLANQNTTPEEREEVMRFLDSRGTLLSEGRIVDRGGVFQEGSGRYNSILITPVKSYKGPLGVTVLLKPDAQGFHYGNLTTATAYSQQAGLIVQNFRLLRHALETERMHGQMAMAKQVQRKLLPAQLDAQGFFQIAAHSTPAREMGGDYYDFISIEPGIFALIVADVSGNGLPAAFGMALLKGIFRSVIQICESPADFLSRANAALAGSLDKRTFVTATVLIIDTTRQCITLSVAGHCAALVYRAHEKQIAPAHQSNGLGLGIARDERYKSFLKNETLYYEAGDMLLLYTDGILDAKSPQTGEEYGEKRVIQFLQNHNNLPLESFVKKLMLDVQNFTQKNYVEDDSTVVCLRF